MCLLCAEGSTDADVARRAHVLRLLTLVEYPDALPADDALRLAREILALAREERAGFRCEAVPPGTALDGYDRRRRS